MIRKRHRWAVPEFAPTVEQCIYCGVTRKEVDTKSHRIYLKTYVRRDGVRFTGFAPECDSSMKFKGFTR